MRAILMYHSIDESGSPISVDPRIFRQHMEFLAKGRPRVVPLAEVAAANAANHTVALTFDDAFANFGRLAAPLLSDLALPATVFVVTDHVGGHNDWGGAGSAIAHGDIPSLGLLPWDALASLAQRGVEIGAHTRRHPHLTAIALSARADEIDGCAERIHSELGTRPTSFAYPYGDLDHGVVAAVRRTYQRACTTELRALEHGDECMRLPRLDAYYLRASGVLEQWGSPAFQRRLWLRAQGRRVRRLVAAAAERV